MLKVTVQRATDLPDVDRFGKSDPYAKVTFHGDEKKTDVQKDCLDPVWNQDFQWDLSGQPLSPDDTLSIEVKDYEKLLARKLLGKVEVPLGELLGTNEIERTYDLVDGKNNPTLGKIMLKIEYSAPAGSGGGDAGGGGEEAGEEGDEGDEEEEDEEEGGDPTQPGQPPKKKRRRKRASRKGRRAWSTKVQDFQIRIRILEGRQLPGSNIHPVVRVTVNGQRRETAVKKSTNKPVYNQTFFFNFHLSEAELFDELVTLEVFNSRKLRSDSLLGYFECDIGGIYEMKGHSFVRKWVLLSAPADRDEDEQEGKSKRTRGGDTPAGYLKVTSMVLGPGDEPPAAANAQPKDIEDDIESNLLTPVGVTRQSAVFTLKVFHAEDLPQMDTGIGRSFKKFFSFFSSDDDKEEDKGKKGLVDPYIEFSFCGKKAKTGIKYHDSDPEFKQFLKIPLMLPSMCERLKLQVFDWDRGSSDDCIGTAFINLSSIAGQGDDEGFLPQFGPCFVNFYGSTREFTNLPDEHDDLNQGIGEGVAYRGRVLVQLTTTLNEELKQPTGVLANEDIIAAQPFLRRERYKLFVCFYEALMVSETDGPVEFEVSIGNNGNKFDESVAACNTPSCNAVYDGCHYYYLPWGHEKPCVCVECSWEDIAFRLEPVNILSKMVERLRESVSRLKQAAELSKVSDDPKVKDMLSSLLDNMARECRTEHSRFKEEIPQLPGKRNSLDNKLHQMRVDEFTFLLEDIGALQWKLAPPLEGEDEKDEVDFKEMFSELDSFVQRLEDLKIEPQVSLPDVVVWMIRGDKRVAYYRMPSHLLLFSETEAACGKFCGKTIELPMKYPGKKGQDVKEHPELPAKLRVEMWLGLEKQQQYWTARPKTEGEFCVFAETYENEVKIISKWTNNKLTRPRFSDSSGDLELPQDKFVPPEGWKFEGGWQKRPELSLFHDPDEGHKEYLVDIFENQVRSFPGGDFKPAGENNWTDANGEEVPGPSAQKAPPGWAWKSKDWEVDNNRAVDGDGWEYTVNPTYGIYGPVMKAYHMSRRRRLVRKRELVDAHSTKKQDQLQKLLAEGWGYAPLFNKKFAAKERKLDFVRRRRWLLKIVPSAGKIDGFSCKLPPILRIQLKSKDQESALCISPRMFVTFAKPHKYQLWVYLYQARDLIAKDDNGMNDPYARVAFGNQSQITNIISQTPCPTWDQTLIFMNMEISEDPENLKRNPPSVVVELFDHDTGMGKDDFLGRCMLTPKIRLKGLEEPEAKLLWHKVMLGEQDGGELLAECELFMDEGAKLPLPPPMGDGGVYPVRSKVRPVLQKTAVEVLCWGVRNMKKFQLTKVTSPSIEFECMGAVLESPVLENTKKMPNFEEPVLERKILNLPVEDLYSPPINIRVRDNRQFGRKPLVGIHSVKSLSAFKCKLPSQTTADDSEVDEVLVDLTDAPPPEKKIWPEKKEEAPPPVKKPKAKAKGKEKDRKMVDPDRFDWWSKYFASLQGAGAGAKISKGEKLVGMFTTDKEGDKASFTEHTQKYLSKGYDTIKVYHKELEKVPEFQGFSDFIATFPLRRGKTKSHKNDDEDEGAVGEFKGAFRIYPIPDEMPDTDLPETMFTNLPSSLPIECTVRVYVVLATDLQPQDPSGLADPYLIVSLGKKKYDDQEDFKPNTLNPVFGKMFEFKTSIPQDKDLKIQVMDYDYLSRDDLIGETVVDLEQRLLSRFHAKCGLHKTYFVSGPNAWRHCEKPFSILTRYCETAMQPFNFFPGKNQNPDRIIIGDREYTLNQFEEGDPPDKEVGPAHERLALHILHTFNMVPEHVETRSLYSPVQPDIQQGKVQMWVDIFPKDDGNCKPPVVIDQRKPVKNELRVIVWNTTDVLLEEESITGEKMSDIYVKAWIDVQNEKQKTDVHYRSLDGDGNFNWRMVFPFDYLPIEKKLVVKKKEHFWSLDETEEKVDAKLKIQIWENDTFSSDDFIGQLELSLNELAKPCVDSDHCGNPKNDPGLSGKTLDLFTVKSTRGWWACYQPDAENPADPTGKVEMTIELLAGWEAEAKPAGQGRDEPNMHPVLPEPDRPATSFLWFTSPFKTLKYIIWRKYKWLILLLLILLIVGLLIGIFIYSMPGYTVKKMFGV
ncbi:myoferlin-like isoform X1 [Stylophora pistillata]|nr:myoferlin-like isoform X1 [Stylophora pistillata]